MRQIIYRYEFSDEISMLEVEGTYLLSAFAVEGLYGEAAARLDLGYAISPKENVIVLDSRNRVAKDLALIFTNLASHEYGADSFTVKRLPVNKKAEEKARKEAEAEEKAKKEKEPA